MGNQAAEFEVRSATDNGLVLDVYSTTDGENLDGWFTRAATLLATGTPVTASAAIAATGKAVDETEMSDWYAVTLAAGSAVVLVSDVPADTTCDVSVFGPDGEELPEAGRYTIRF